MPFSNLNYPRDQNMGSVFQLYDPSSEVVKSAETRVYDFPQQNQLPQFLDRYPTAKASQYHRIRTVGRPDLDDFLVPESTTINIIEHDSEEGVLSDYDQGVIGSYRYTCTKSFNGDDLFAELLAVKRRASWLPAHHHPTPKATVVLVAKRENQTVGYGLLRTSKIGVLLGPLYADNEKIARLLLSRFVGIFQATQKERTLFFMEVLGGNANRARVLAKELGLRVDLVTPRYIVPGHEAEIEWPDYAKIWATSQVPSHPV